MQVAYLPTIEHLTGIALLYRGPQASFTSTLLTSNLEQTGIIGIDLPLGEGQVGVYGAWIGLEPDEAARQVTEALEFIGDRSIVAFAGDFNLENGDLPISEILAAGFIDPFLALGMNPPPPTVPAIEPTRQIDFVWLRAWRRIAPKSRRPWPPTIVWYWQAPVGCDGAIEHLALSFNRLIESCGAENTHHDR